MFIICFVLLMQSRASSSDGRIYICVFAPLAETSVSPAFQAPSIFKRTFFFAPSGRHIPPNLRFQALFDGGSAAISRCFFLRSMF